MGSEPHQYMCICTIAHIMLWSVAGGVLCNILEKLITLSDGFANIYLARCKALSFNALLATHHPEWHITHLIIEYQQGGWYQSYGSRPGAGLTACLFLRTQPYKDIKKVHRITLVRHVCNCTIVQPSIYWKR